MQSVIGKETPIPCFGEYQSKIDSRLDYHSDALLEYSCVFIANTALKAGAI